MRAPPRENQWLASAGTRCFANGTTGMDIPRARLGVLGALALLLVRSADSLAQAVPSAAPARRDTLIREFRGSYQRGFEQSWFVPCTPPASDDKLWWVTLTDQALAERDSILAKLTSEKGDGLMVRWRATLGPKMPAGMMGRGTRYMLVTEILDIKPVLTGGACSPERAS